MNFLKPKLATCQSSPITAVAPYCLQTLSWAEMALLNLTQLAFVSGAPIFATPSRHLLKSYAAQRALLKFHTFHEDFSSLNRLHSDFLKGCMYLSPPPTPGQ